MRRATLALVLLCGSALARAHHVMNNQLPATLAEGLLSGLGHPVLGIDHLAFIVGAGLFLGVVAGGAWGIVALLGGSLVGIALHLAGAVLPGTEIVIVATIAAVVLGLVARRRWPLRWVMPVMAIAGVFHGTAFAESIFGAEASALAGYVAGLIAMQAALASAAFLLRRRFLLRQ